MVAAFGLAYLVIGLAFGALAANAATVETRQLWRFAAWFLSAIAFSFHLWYEFIRRQRAPFGTALRAAAAVAVGGFGLALAANVHARAVGATNRGFIVALVAWPLLLAVPAFIIAWAATAILARTRSN